MQKSVFGHMRTEKAQTRLHCLLPEPLYIIEFEW